MIIVLIALLLFCTLSLDLAEYKQSEHQNPQEMFNSYEPNFQRYTKLSTLIFYTPWNSAGKTLVKKYAKKFDYVSPCWYQFNVKSLKSKTQILVEHESNYDAQILMDLKTQNPNIKILPRLYVPGDRVQLLQALGSSGLNLKMLFNKVKELSKLKDIDGFVWDSPFNQFSTASEAKGLNQLVKQIINGIKNVIGQKLLFVNIANPQNEPRDYSLIRSLSLDGLIIQNYGEMGYQTCIQSSKKFLRLVNFQKSVKTIFVLPFFTKKSNGQLINTMEAQNYMEQHGLSKCYFEQICKFISDQIIFEIPCLNYFDNSYNLIGEQHGVGFWEAGNGLERFYSFI